MVSTHSDSNMLSTTAIVMPTPQACVEKCIQTNVNNKHRHISRTLLLSIYYLHTTLIWPNCAGNWSC